MSRQGLIPAALAAAVTLTALSIWFVPGDGRAAPDVPLETLAGDTVRLSELEGAPVMLQFWATTCRTCVAEMPHLKALHRELGDDGFELVAVAMPYDPPDQVRRMSQEKQLPYTVALDRDGAITSAFGDVRLTPTTVLINAEGRIAWQRRGELDFDRLEREISRMLTSTETG
jgi:peroxiredoxin